MTRRLFLAIPAAVVAGLALATLPAQVRTASALLSASPPGIARDAEAARRQLRGDAYVTTIAEVAARIPAAGAYVIADEGSPEPDANWVRCDLAPRVPVRVQPGRCGDWHFDRPPKAVPELAVHIARDGGLRLVKTRALLTDLWSGLPEPVEELSGWIDEPAEGRTVAGRFLVRGWCQEKGGRPCTAVRVWVDGREVDAARIERFPRPDVEAALPEMGDCSRAGWSATFEPGEIAPGRHCLAAALIAEGGRHRRVGPWAFTVAP